MAGVCGELASLRYLSPPDDEFRSMEKIAGKLFSFSAMAIKMNNCHGPMTTFEASSLKHCGFDRTDWVIKLPWANRGIM